MKKRFLCLLALAVSLLWASSALATTITVDYLTSLDPANDPAWHPPVSAYDNFYGYSSLSNTQSGLTWTMTAHYSNGSAATIAWNEYPSSHPCFYGYPRSWLNGLGVYDPSYAWERTFFNNGNYLEITLANATGAPVFLRSLTWGNIGTGESWGYQLLYANGSTSSWISGLGGPSIGDTFGQAIVSFGPMEVTGMRVGGAGQWSGITFQGFSVETQTSPPNPNPTPEPGTLALMASALGTGLWLRRRRAKKAPAPGEGRHPS